jgi:outer membrane protein OmpA-like peptidoglycan-associated protein
VANGAPNRIGAHLVGDAHVSRHGSFAGARQSNEITQGTSMKTRQLLLAGTMISALVLGAPVLARAADGAIVVAQQQDKTPPDQTPPAKKPAPGAPGTPPAHSKGPPHPTAQQPAPQKPVVQQAPVNPQHPAGPHPNGAPPKAAQQPPPAPQKPVVQQAPVNPQHPAERHPDGAPPKAAQQPPPAPQKPVVQQAPVAPQHPSAQQPNGAAPKAAQQPPPAPQKPVVQQAPIAPQHPTAQQAVPPAGPAGATVAPIARDRQQVLEQNKRAEEWRTRRLQDLQAQRQQVTEGNRTIIREPGRTIIREDGRTIIRHNEIERFGFNARDVQVEQRGRDTVTVVERPGGVRIVTVVDENGRLLRRSRRGPDGREIIIIDNPVRDFRRAHEYYVDLPPPVIRIPRDHYIVETERADEAAIYMALTAPPVDRIERRYTLDEIRYSPMLRERMPRVDIDTVNFDTGSWEVTPDQAPRLAVIADAIRRAVARNPQEVFLIEGHTDAVGSDVDNLSLSDRRAESVAVVLTEQFQVPPENLTTQGYGEQYLKIPTPGPERRNRRVTVRRITPLLVGENGARPY